jgi:hypothetical protein
MRYLHSTAWATLAVCRPGFKRLQSVEISINQYGSFAISNEKC